MLKLFKNIRGREWLFVWVSVVFIVVQVWMDLTVPDYMSEITMLVQTPGSEMTEILAAGVKMLLFAFGSLAASVVTAICASKISSEFGAVLRSKLFRKVQAFSMEEIGRFSTASLITRSTNDITQVQMLIVLGLQMLIKAPIMAVWAIIKISGKEWEWTFSTGIAVAILLIIVLICIFLTMPKYKKLQTLTDELNRVTRENVSGLRVVRAYNAEEYQEKKFESTNENLTNTSLFTMRVMSFMMPGISLVMSGLSLSVYWIGAILINEAKMTDKATLFSDMMVFSQYAVQVVMSFMMLVMIFMILPRASVSARRIGEVLDLETAMQNGKRTDGEQEKTGEVEFRNVSFRYPDAGEYVVKNITFTAKKGETVALIGSTGCGKSTVVNLVPRFYDATEGEVLVDGVNVKEYDEHALRNKIGYVSQKAMLFSGTVKSNIAYGDNGRAKPGMDEIAAAVSLAQAEDFAGQAEDSYNGHVAQGGTNFSGGQKQRLSIARAIARKPEIFIFDDSFSALDYGTDRRLREALERECKNATKLIVAQRIGTIRDANQIIVLDDGKIAGMGSHRELLDTCEVYRQIALSQLSKEELT